MTTQSRNKREGWYCGKNAKGKPFRASKLVRVVFLEPLKTYDGAPPRQVASAAEIERAYKK